MLLYISNM